MNGGIQKVLDNDDFKDDTLTEAITSHRTVVLVQPENKAWVNDLESRCPVLANQKDLKIP